MQASIKRKVEEFAATLRTGAAPADDDSEKKQFAARLAALEQRMEAYSAGAARTARVARFAALIAEEERKSGGRLRLTNAAAVADAAADMPEKQEFKAQDPKTGRLSSVTRDIGELHVRQVLAEAAAGVYSAPPAAGASMAAGHEADPDVDGYKHSSKALRVAMSAAKEYDNNEMIRRVARSGRRAFIAGEVYAATGENPKD